MVSYPIPASHHVVDESSTPLRMICFSLASSILFPDVCRAVFCVVCVGVGVGVGVAVGDGFGVGVGVGVGEDVGVGVGVVVGVGVGVGVDG